ncbi:MAG: hypothetical protein GX154_11800 [Clostridiales bacterium]|jgi:hypothetical protein|nr:hypothetical protein [Clostridiales bacterium]
MQKERCAKFHLAQFGRVRVFGKESLAFISVRNKGNQWDSKLDRRGYGNWIKAAMRFIHHNVQMVCLFILTFYRLDSVLTDTSKITLFYICADQ